MAEYHGVFERKEVKYRLSSAQYRAVLSALRGRLAPDAYGSALVKSVYFDTDERDMIAHSLEKPLYKEKLRVRSYGTPSEADPVFVEIKKKYDGVVYKRRIAMSYAAARAYLGGASYEAACIAHPLDEPGVFSAFAKTNLQVAHEIDALMRRWGPLRASMLTTCVRTAYGPIDESGVGVADEGGCA
ncbi:polyphosphate polymerase domain-containing protein [uncultured Slackia sp.]|uniref:polyphosphate polymerase domain-containing protein n=1 Tax=uncultured Slackia sp. TaxID=665903 RepID=UPI0026DF3E0B|nr:polyphosphate polymerase domain-containing protein [uncultured Slackia sp.]